MKETITKKYTNKYGEEITTEYRIDSDFEPKEAKEICIEFIVNYCKAQGKEAVKWLYDLMNTNIVFEKEDGEKDTRKITHLEIRKQFVEKYFAHIIKEDKSKKKKIDSLLEDLEAFLNQ